MANIEPTQQFPIEGNHDFVMVAWSGLTVNDTGAPFVLSQYADRSAQVEGTFGAGGVVVIEGTNDGINWRTLNDPYSIAISISTPKIQAISELVSKIRPRVISGDGTTSVTISMLMRKNK